MASRSESRLHPACTRCPRLPVFALVLAALASSASSHAQAPAANIKPPSTRLIDAEQSFSGSGNPAASFLSVFLEEADAGSPAAKRDLGLLYLRGYQWHPPNAVQALQSFEAAAIAGDLRAPSYIGDFYLDPHNGPIDPANALYWYQKGAHDHDARATLALANLSCKGVGVPHNVATCGRLLQRANTLRKPSDPNDVVITLAKSFVALGNDYRLGNGAPHRPAAAALWFSRAARLNYIPGAIAQSRLYVDKGALPQNLPRATAILDAILKHYEQFPGPQTSDPVAKTYIDIGKAYEARGSRGFSSAAAVYIKAYDLNFPVPLIALARRYITGSGTPVDLDRAYTLLKPLAAHPRTTDITDLRQAFQQLSDAYAHASPPNTARAEEMHRYATAPMLLVPTPAADEAFAPPQPMAERFPNLSAPDTVAPQQTFEVDVSLNAIQYDQSTQVLSGQQDAANGKLQITLPDGMTSMPIQIDLILPTGMAFASGSNNSSTLTLDSTKPNSTVAIFNVIAGSAPASGLLRATLSYHQNFIAQIGRPIAIVAPTTAPPSNETLAPPTPTLPAPSQPASNVADTRSDNGPLVQKSIIKPVTPTPIGSAPTQPRVTLTAPAPKLTPIVIDPTARSTDLTITETLNGDTMHYNFQSILGASDADVPNAAATRAAVQQMFDTLQSQAITVLSAGAASSDVALCTAAHAKGIAVGDKDPSCADSLQARATAQGIGSKLYNDYAPPVFRTIYQLLVADHIRLHTITVVTNSPTLPWELMLPQPGTDNYLGLTTAIVRQNTASPFLAPTLNIPFSSVAIVAPNYSGDKQLPAVLTEIKSIQTDFPAAQVIPGDAADVSTLVRNDPATIIHYSGHGQLVPTAPNAPSSLAPQAAIVLEDASMTPDTFTAFRDQGNQDAHPFYFFNACDIGQSSRQLNYIEGWAPALMQSGASGYLGALYEVGDSSAASFAAHFYADLKSSLNSHTALSTADLVTQARRQTYAEAYDPTALAYVLYANPFMTLVAANR